MNDPDTTNIGHYDPQALPQTRSFSELPPLSLYIHIPWCIAKCPYCDFNSHKAPSGELPENTYIEALLHDLESEVPDIWGRQISSVFIGGGTPSLFSASAIDRLLSGVRALLTLPPGIEITLEANPGTFEQQRFADFNAAGINRLSLGIQSFNDHHLKALGRVHGSDESLRAAELARAAGFDNFNLDLMYGLPGQTVNQALEDLQQAINVDPKHLSLYQLTLEPNTLFHKYPPELPDHDALHDMQQAISEQLRQHDYRRYEISAWARNGAVSEHNRNYWQFGDYIGIGAGAHGKISRADTATITRRIKQKKPEHYLATAGRPDCVIEQHEIPLADTGLEFMMNALRLVDGFNPLIFRSHTGIDIQPWKKALDAAEAAGLLNYSAVSIRPTDRGLDFLNDLLEHFMSPV